MALKQIEKRDSETLDFDPIVMTQIPKQHSFSLVESLKITLLFLLVSSGCIFLFCVIFIWR